jgi:formylglycine-generating enzyme required for sulfatase activity
MDTAKSVTATFIQQYALTTNVTGAGSVSPSSGGVYDTGALVELTATPEEGWRFDYWSEDLTGSENPVSITMDTAKSVTATFSINQYTLTYTAGDNGSITGATSQTVNYGTNGTAVEAVPATSYHFVRWSDDSTQNPRIDANVTADINVTATFSINEYTLTYTAGDNGSITGETPQTVNHGASGTAVEAVPTTGYHFIRWSDTSTANPRADSDVTGDISVMAEFASNTETIVLPGGIPLEMVWIPAGAFQMGRNPSEQDSYANEDPRHVVAFASGFWMGKYELTQAQWVAVMGNNPSSYTGDLQRPVETVSWNDIQVFIAFLNIATGKTFRLPSEAEREYACRAGTTTRFYWGDDTSYTEIDNYAWYQGNSAGKTHAVGGKLPNGWGLYDMSGNVYEYCEDDWHESYSGAPANGNAWVDSPRNSLRVLRGGGFDFTGIPCRSAVRGREGLSGAYSNFGLRLAR